MIIEYNDIVKAKAKELGIDKDAALFASRAIYELPKIIVERCGYEKKEYSKDEFYKKFKTCRFIIPKVGMLMFYYYCYKKRLEYLKNKKNNVKSNKNKTDV